MLLDIKTYYDQTRFDYRVAWNNRKNLAIHFGFYDENASRHADALLNTNRVLADLADIKTGEKVLDAGCGIGGSAFWLAENRGAEVVGIAPVESQIFDCKKAAASGRGAGRVEFLVADYLNTPFPDAHFDVVWALESQCHAANKLDFYREAHRILKPGGRLVVADYFRASRPFSEEKENLLASWLRTWAIRDLDTMEEHQANAQFVGFQSIDIQDVTSKTRVSLRNLHELSSRWLGWGQLLRFFRLISAVRLQNVRGSIHQFEALEARLWFYALFLARK